jgi:DNA-binding transcriptional ArsR family regulator
MLSVMANSEPQTIDKVFLALGHPVRREILVRLAQGSATVMEIAEPYEISLNAISKHLKILEKANLIQRRVIGREHYCSISPEPLAEITNWLNYYQSFWTVRLDALEQAIIAKRQAKDSDRE